jgi:hypothetical protein
VSNIFRPQYRELTTEEKTAVELIKKYARDLDDLYVESPTGITMTREMVLARMKLEESVMWAVKGITG